MSRLDIEIQALTQNAEKALDKLYNTYENKPLKIKVDIDTKQLSKLLKAANIDEAINSKGGKGKSGKSVKLKTYSNILSDLKKQRTAINKEITSIDKILNEGGKYLSSSQKATLKKRKNELEGSRGLELIKKRQHATEQKITEARKKAREAGKDFDVSTALGTEADVKKLVNTGNVIDLTLQNAKDSIADINKSLNSNKFFNTDKALNNLNKFYKQLKTEQQKYESHWDNSESHDFYRNNEEYMAGYKSIGDTLREIDKFKEKVSGKEVLSDKELKRANDLASVSDKLYNDTKYIRSNTENEARRESNLKKQQAEADKARKDAIKAEHAAKADMYEGLFNEIDENDKAREEMYQKMFDRRAREQAALNESQRKAQEIRQRNEKAWNNKIKEIGDAQVKREFDEREKRTKIERSQRQAIFKEQFDEIKQEEKQKKSNFKNELQRTKKNLQTINSTKDKFNRTVANDNSGVYRTASGVNTEVAELSKRYEAKSAFLQKRVDEASKRLQTAEATGNYKGVEKWTAELQRANIETDRFIKLSDVQNKAMADEAQAFKTLSNNALGFNKIYDKSLTFMNDNMMALMFNPQIKKQFEDFNASLFNGDFKSVKAAAVEFSNIKKNAQLAGIGVETLGTKIQKAFQGKIFSQFSYMGIMAITSTVSDLISNVKEIDSAMTELKKVTNGTSSDYDNFLAGAETRAKNVGASLAEVVNATADYARLGYSIPDASKLADTALIYSNVGDDVEDITQATESMISTMQGFNIAAEDSMSIVDKFNEV